MIRLKPATRPITVRHQMAIEQLISPAFANISRQRGLSYYERGLVDPTKAVAGSHATFHVTGSKLYTTSIKYSPEKRELIFQCNCPHFADNFLCKHLWASVLKADELGVFMQLGPRSQLTVRHGHDVNFKSSDPTHQVLPEGPRVLTLIKKKDTPTLPTVPSVTPPTASPVSQTQKIPGWKVNLQEAEKKLAAEKHEGPSFYRDKIENKKTAHFGLDLKKSIENSSICLRFLVQEHLKNGALGVIKQAELNHNAIQFFPDEKDQTALLMLLGKTQLGGDYYSSRAGVMSVSVPLKYVDEILTAVGATERFHLIRNGDLYYSSRNERLDLEPYGYLGNVWHLQLELNRSGKAFHLSGALMESHLDRQRI